MPPTNWQPATIVNINPETPIELEMNAAGVVNYGTDLDNPDFAGIAQLPVYSARRHRNQTSLRPPCVQA
jgi:hypothetical protein